MSGAGRRVFQPGEVLTATNVQNYLQDQAVQYYAGTAARGSAIGTATTEGMVSYLADSNKLQVATGTATWQPISMVQSVNYIHNGGMDVNQRGATVTTNGAYCADRWIIGSSAGTNSVVVSGSAPANVGLTYSLQFTGTNTTNPLIRQRIESADAIQFAGRTVTLSFWAVSTVGTGAVKVNTAYPTTTADTFGTWASPTTTADQSALAVTPTGNISGTWTQYAVTFAVSANASRGYQVDIYRESTTSSTTTRYSGIQLELGETVNDFRRNSASYKEELATCQRFYMRYSFVTGASTIVGHTTGTGTTTASTQIYFPVNMRTTPSTTIEWSGTGSHYSAIGLNGSGATISNTTGIAINSSYVSPQSALLSLTGTGYTSGNQYALTIVNTSGYLGFSAEL